MPVLRFKLDRLYELLKLEPWELSELLFKLKCESEVKEGYLEVEINADRPDMFISEGLARAIKGLMGVETGWRKPRVVDSGFKLVVEDVPSRPYIVAAVIYNVNIDSVDFLEELIQFQEKLHDGLGRRRRKAAIGLHDASKIPDPNLRYAMAPLDTMFKPLGYDRYMRAGDVLELDEKGRSYGWIARFNDKHPFIFSGDEIITMPPVLNSDITRLEVGTRDVLVDVTGTDLWTVEAVLNIIVSSLAERPGAYVGLVEVKAPWGGFYPKLEPSILRFNYEDVNRILGAEFGVVELARILERMRYNVRVEDGILEVEIPPFRVDVSGVVDIAEDVAIAVGYENLNPRNQWVTMRGELDEVTRLARAIRVILVGLGFTEVMRLTLVSPSLLESLGLREQALEVLNPVQVEYSVLRPSLTTTILEVLVENRHSPKPIKVFEIGPVMVKTETGIVEDERVALAVMDEEVSYEDLQAPVYYMLRALGLEPKAIRSKTSITLDGRTASIEANGVNLGYIGEVKPEVLEELELEYPVVVAELSINNILEALKKTQY